MRNGPHGTAGRGADGDVRAETPPLPFVLIRFEPCSYGSKAAQGTIAIRGLGELQVELFRPPGKASFAAPGSIRSRYSGAYERAAKFDDAFAEALREALETQLRVDEAREHAQ
jgi:hypothetical protein